MRVVLFLTIAVVYSDKYPPDRAILGNSTDLHQDEKLHRNKRWIEEVIQYAPAVIDFFTGDGMDNLGGSISTLTTSIQDVFSGLFGGSGSSGSGQSYRALETKLDQIQRTLMYQNQVLEKGLQGISTSITKSIQSIVQDSRISFSHIDVIVINFQIRI